MEEDRKQEILTRAFELIDILLKRPALGALPPTCMSTDGNFDYYSQNGIYKSSDLAKEVLLSFMQSLGYYLPDNHSLRNGDAQAFRDKFVEQIELLIGRKPRVSRDVNGRYIIWYS